MRSRLVGQETIYTILVGQEDQQGRRLKKASWQELIGSIKEFAEEHVHIEVQEKVKTDLAET